MESPKFPQEGGCMCGKVRYRLLALPKAVYSCHCKDCQRLSNGTHTISMMVPREDAELISGELDVFEKKADSGRVVRMLRCKYCGTTIWNEPEFAPAIRVMKAGNLDDMSWAQPVGNIWTSSKVPWFEIDPDVPNISGQPEDRQVLLAAWAAAHSDAD